MAYKEDKRRLSMQITAENRAAAAFSALHKNLSKTNHAFTATGRAAAIFKRDMASAGTVIKLTTAPLRALVAAVTAAKVVMIAGGVAAVKAAGDYETYRQQLRTVIKTKQEADLAFKESIDFSVSTPFTPEDIIKTRIALEGVGVAGADAVKAVAEVAAALDRNILDVASAVKSMEAEPLRNLNAYFELKDRVGTEFRKDAKSFREAQNELLKIFEEKYGGGVARMSVTLQGLVSTLDGVRKNVAATFGEGMLSQSKLFLYDLITAGTTLQSSAESAGKTFGQEMMHARNAIMAGFDVAMQVAGQIRDTLGKGNGLGSVIHEAFAAGATIVGQGIIGAFKVTLPMWKTIGTIIGEGALAAFYNSDLPFANTARQGAIARNLEGKQFKDLAKLATSLGVKYSVVEKSSEKDYVPDMMGAGSYLSDLPGKTTSRYKTNAELARDLAAKISTFPKEDQLKYAEHNPAKIIADNIEATRQTFVTEMSNLQMVSLGSLQQFSDAMATASGTEKINLATEFAAAMKTRQAEGEKLIAEWDAKLNATRAVAPQQSPAGVLNGEGATAAGLIEESLKASDTIASDMARMYGQIDKMSERSYQAQKTLLDEQVRNYQEKKIDQLAIDQWYTEQVKKLDIQRGQSSNSVIEGMHAAYLQMKREELTAGEIGYSASMTLRDSMRENLIASSNDWKMWGENAKNILRDVLVEIQRMMIIKNIADPASTFLTKLGGSIAGALFPSKGLGGGGVVQPATNTNVAMAHSGWLVGSTPPGTRSVSPSLFNSAPRLHNGLAGDEFPAILQRGEQVIPRGGSGPNVNVQIINNGTAQRVTNKQATLESGRMFLKLWTQDFANEGETFAAVKTSKGLIH